MKKGYFFMVDALMAVSIIVFCVIMLFSFSRTRPYTSQGVFYTDDLDKLLFNTQVFELDNPFVYSLYSNGSSNITDTHNTIAEQATVFFVTGRPQLARAFILNITKGLLSEEKYGVTFRVYNKTSSYTVPINNGPVASNSSRLRAISREIIYGYATSDTSYGPMTAEVTVWQ